MCADPLDDLSSQYRREFLDEALALQSELDDDEAVDAYMRHVGTGMSPTLHFDLTPKQWLDALGVRLQTPE